MRNVLDPKCFLNKQASGKAAALHPSQSVCDSSFPALSHYLRSSRKPSGRFGKTSDRLVNVPTANHSLKPGSAWWFTSISLPQSSGDNASKQTTKQASTHAGREASRQASKQAKKQRDKLANEHTKKQRKKETNKQTANQPSKQAIKQDKKTRRQETKKTQAKPNETTKQAEKQANRKP